MIHLRHVTKAYQERRVLRSLDLVAEPGGITLLVGANGAGKSTTLRICSGLLDADAGTVTIAGHDLRRDRAQALAHLSFLPQAPRFHPRLTTLQVARFHGELRGRSPRDVELALAAWGLTEHRFVPTAKLSGGLRQRLALAIFALADAPVRLLDEPGLSLDPEWRERLQAFLVAEAERGRTVVVATHLLGEWEGRAHRCLRLVEGRCGGELPPDQLRDVFQRVSAVVGSRLLPACA